MGAWDFLLTSAQAHKIPRFRGGFVLEGVVEVPILFLWARGFSELCKLKGGFLFQPKGVHVVFGLIRNCYNSMVPIPTKHPVCVFFCARAN